MGITQHELSIKPANMVVQNLKHIHIYKLRQSG